MLLGSSVSGVDTGMTALCLDSEALAITLLVSILYYNMQMCSFSRPPSYRSARLVDLLHMVCEQGNVFFPGDHSTVLAQRQDCLGLLKCTLSSFPVVTISEGNFLWDLSVSQSESRLYLLLMLVVRQIHYAPII